MPEEITKSTLPTQTPRNPKVELHVHLDGAIRHNTVWKLAQKKGIKVAGNDEEEFKQHIKSLEKGTLTKFLQVFQEFMPVIVGDLEAIGTIAYEFCHDKASEDVLYFEARFCPQYLATSGEDGVTADEVVERVCKEIDRGCKDFGINGNIILCIIRGANPEWAKEVVDLCKKYKDKEGCRVVAIDIAGDETEFPLQPEQVEAFEEAERLGISRTAHAGESGPAENVQISVDKLKAQRIGHGYHIVEDEAVYKMVQEKNIHLEVCPLSSVNTGACSTNWSEHPLIRFANDGLNFGLNTDDPTVLCNTLNDDFKIAKEEIKLTDEQIKKSVFNAARASFLSDEEKEALIKQLEDAYNN